MARPTTLVAARPLGSQMAGGVLMAGAQGRHRLAARCRTERQIVDESVGMLSVAAVLVFGIWLVDYSGDATRASAGIHAAGTEAAHYAAAALASPPPGITDAALDRHATAIAERVVGAAAVSGCDASDARFDVAAAVHRLPGDTQPAAISVEVTCPLAVSSVFTDTISARIAVPVPADPAVQP